ncbi:sodium/hydrogen exchanger 9B2 [Hyalella azteca]|uniref:Sodium/hydrogen exchanger 9B2 n=1 Tax=Hyalella azteca TaxID=294128 RepID=A0A8B7NTL3_HYAAZ|nr:sodium/hydrogen exchanger 9B2 [Hyalella azteca]XP_047735494.1 sodium/hydrogen exchanger 9B2 [Hyalella azteca]
MPAEHNTSRGSSNNSTSNSAETSSSTIWPMSELAAQTPFSIAGVESPNTILNRLDGFGSRLKICGCFRQIMQKNNPLPPTPTRSDRLKYAFTCPPHGMVGAVVTLVALYFLAWGSLYSITGNFALPGGTLFSLLIVFICSTNGGRFTQLYGLPAFPGMLFAGFLLANIPGVRIIGDSIEPNWHLAVRNFSLVVILTRAGLYLEPKVLKTMYLAVTRLAFVPCLVETFVVAIVAHFLLGLPWLWGFMLGFVVAPVSPAVMVPCMLVLARLGYEKRILSFVTATTIVEDVFAIACSNILLGVIFSGGSLSKLILHGPLEVLIALTYGVVMGFVCWILPNKQHPGGSVVQYLVLLTAGLVALFGSSRTEFGGAGALAVVVLGFVAGEGYRRQGWGDVIPVMQHFSFTWDYCQPMIVALVGSKVRFNEMEQGTIWLGVALLCISLTCRVVTTFFVVLGSGFNIRERFFVALAWLAKANVQAVINSTALEYAVSIGANESDVFLAKQVQTIALLVILISSPLGSSATMCSASRLVQRQNSCSEPAASEPV